MSGNFYLGVMFSITKKVIDTNTYLRLIIGQKIYERNSYPNFICQLANELNKIKQKRQPN